MTGTYAEDDAAFFERLGARVHKRRGRKSPLVPTIANVLREAVEDGDLPPGAKLANEIVLAERIDVSRPTLRQAISILVHEGTLELRRGVGTFVAEKRPRIRSDVERMRSATDLIRAAGREPGTRNLRVDEKEANPAVAAALGLPKKSPVIVITRTRTADSEPLMVCYEYLPAAVFGSVTDFTTFDGASLYHFLAAHFDQRVDQCESSIAAVPATAEVARRLRIARNEPVLELTQTHLVGGKPLFFSHNFHNSALVRFETRRIVLPENAGE